MSRPPSSPPPGGTDASDTAEAGDRVERVPPRRGTLPPPDWAAPRSVSALALQWLADKAPVSRRRGSRADLASLEAEYRAAIDGTDDERTRAACSSLARALVGRGMELDRATKLARRALMLGDDRALREELSLWFAALGEAALAAATLQPLEEVVQGPVLAKVLTRIAVFRGRAGDALAAADALERAAEADPTDPLPPELLAGLFVWAPDAVSRDRAARGYYEGSRRREAAGDAAGAFEDLLRAFDVSPAVSVVARRLAAQLGARGRARAADEVLRESANAAGEGGVDLHRDRMRDAALDGDIPRALGAALDAHADAELSLDALVAAVDRATSASFDAPTTFDALLVHGGLGEVLAARLALAADLAGGAQRARALVALGRLHAGPLGSPELAVEAWIDAVVADPSHEPAKAVLREHGAATGDASPLVEALIRAEAVTTPELGQARHDCTQELLLLAEQKLGDPTLALWAADRLLLQGADVDTVQSVVERLAPRANAMEAELMREREAAEGLQDAARLEQLAWVADLLESRPQNADELVEILRELHERSPDEPRWRAKLMRLLGRLGDRAGLEELLAVDLRPSRPRATADAARVLLATLRRRSGDLTGALGLLAGSLEDSTPMRASWCAAYALACHLGERSRRAWALARLSNLWPSSLRAVLASVASEELLAVDEKEPAREAAEEACHADPSAPRGIVALSRALEGTRDRAAALSLERAMGVVIVRSASCRALGDVLEALGDAPGALGWTQRWVALRPGDPEAAAALLDRVVKAGDAARLGDVLSFLVSQPQPLGTRSAAVARALCRLAEMDPLRGVAAGRRALDVYGPRLAELRDAVLAVADTSGDGGLAIALLERQLASGTPGSDRAELLLDLARRRRAMGDGDGAAMTLVRALSEGADADRVLGELDVALPPETSDGEIALLRARAEGFSGSTSADLQTTAHAWRRYGAALWDMAGDRTSAMNAWLHAASLDPDDGMEKMARDLVSFAGHEQAVELLLGLVTDDTGPESAGEILTCAAGVALDHGLDALALTAGLRALDADPTRADVLAVVERAAGPADIDALERAYDRAAAGALGIYGTRAAHYRAARQLERRGERERALRHAVVAFESVPAEGVTFILMMRLAERLRDSAEALEAIDRVASAAKTSAERSAWLRRAALVAGTSDEGKRQRVDVLLRALEAAPDRDTLRSLGRAFAELNRILPEERDIGEMRFRRAVERILERSDGPDGARMGVDAAKASLDAFGGADLAVRALSVAVDTDASIDEYEQLLGEAAILATAEASKEFVQRVSDLCTAEYSNVEAPACELAVAIARARNDERSCASILVARAERHSDDPELVRRAQEAAAASGDADLQTRIAHTLPPERRGRALLETGRSAESAGDDEEAALAFEQLRALDGALPEHRVEALVALERLYDRAGRKADLEALLRDAVEGGGLDRAEHGRVVVALARVLVSLGNSVEARERTAELLDARPGDTTLADAVAVVARDANDVSWQGEVLQRRLEAETSRGGRLATLRKLATLYEQAGDTPSAVGCYRHILELDERDVTAFAALERDAERRGEMATLVELLERHATILTNPREARRLRLRRVELLETKLGRLDDARSVLEAMLRSGEHADVLTRLADLHHRLGDDAHAAPLWLRASRAATSTSDAAQLARRACRGFLDSGDVDKAREALEALSRYPRSLETVELRVEIERRSENPAGLSEALEDMALSSLEAAPQRAALLVEAARAALSAGDEERALAQAQRGARIAQSAVEPQLFARRLEYQRRGAGSAEDARATIASLSGLKGALTPAQRELRAFLLAEALDVARGGKDAAMRELSQVHAELGDVALVALGMAERLAVGSVPQRSLGLFDAALSGDLQGLRSPSDVALAAAEAARRAGLPERALAFLDKVAMDAEAKPRALELQAQIRSEQKRVSDRPPARGSAPPSHPPQTEVVMTTRGVAPPARGSAPAPSDTGEAEPMLLSRPVSHLPKPPPKPRTTVNIDRSVVPDAPTQREPIPLMRQRGSGTEIPPPPSLRDAAPPKPTELPPMTRAAQTLIGGPSPSPAASSGARDEPHLLMHRVAEPSITSTGSDASDADGEPAPIPLVHSASPSPPTAPMPAPILTEGAATAERSSASVAVAEHPPVKPTPADGMARVSMPPVPPAQGDGEASLVRALDNGSVMAGRELVRRLERAPERSQDLVDVCRRLAALLPGDLDVLQRLHAAAEADGARAYAEAIQHVLHAFRPDAEPVEPPPLVEQLEQAERVRAMLLKDAASPAAEALALVWNAMPNAFRCDAKQLGLTGSERVAAGSPLPVARLHAAATTLVGASATPLFVVKADAPVRVEVTLLQAPTIVVRGEVGEVSPRLAFDIGAALACSAPEHVLPLAASEAQLRDVLGALGLAFGPPQAGAKQSPNVASLAGSLWETVPARAQRRLSELCDDPSALDFELAVAGARQVARRFGLFVCGDLLVALGDTCRSLGISPESLERPGGLAAVCAATPAVADLVRLATSAEFADARWHRMAGASRHLGAPWSRL